jgi:hypothetical protein
MQRQVSPERVSCRLSRGGPLWRALSSEEPPEQERLFFFVISPASYTGKNQFHALKQVVSKEFRECLFITQYINMITQ